MFWLIFVCCCRYACSSSNIHTHGTTYRDTANRTRLFHGINYVQQQKVFPYIPEINAAEIVKLQSIGANVVRLGVMIEGLFPASATPNASYLPAIKAQVDLLWQAGIYSILDLHQDVLSAQICGEGVPEWMFNVSNLHSLPFPLPAAFANVSKADPTTGQYVPAPDCAPRGLLKFIGWSQFYMTDSSGKAWDHLFHNTSLLGHMIEQHWLTVATYFKGHPGILAYEMMNEPWVGDHVANPLLLLKGGVAEALNVGPFMTRIHAAIRTADPTTMTLYAPAEVNNRCK